MRMIERQLQTAVNNILKWCDTNGHISASKQELLRALCRKRGTHPDPEIRIRDIPIPVVPDVRFSDSACNSTLKNLTLSTIWHRICSVRFCTSPVQSLYVICHQLPRSSTEEAVSLRIILRSYPCFTSSAECVYEYQHEETFRDARPSNIRPFMDRMKLSYFLNSTYLTCVSSKKRTFPIPTLEYATVPLYQPFATCYSKSTVAPVVFQRVFAYHRSQYSRYSAIYT
ncbi:putative RNA-directed DNA polymerase from transposon BS [Trichonephila clavipes]|nr:putative RNA-directed DNA polymerase from transposon BS [Trichonephila clavipes]